MPKHLTQSLQRGVQVGYPSMAFNGRQYDRKPPVLHTGEDQQAPLTRVQARLTAVASLSPQNHPSLASGGGGSMEMGSLKS
jgi:hypothetical protein